MLKYCTKYDLCTCNPGYITKLCDQIFSPHQTSIRKLLHNPKKGFLLEIFISIGYHSPNLIHLKPNTLLTLVDYFISPSQSCSHKIQRVSHLFRIDLFLHSPDLLYQIVHFMPLESDSEHVITAFSLFKSPQAIIMAKLLANVTNSIFQYLKYSKKKT